MTESWLTDSIYNAELFDARYNVFRQDRNSGKTRGGGLIVAGKKIFAMEKVEFTCTSDIECIVTRISFKKGNVLYLFCVYMPPNSSCDSIKEFLDAAEDIVQNNNQALILGDFNIPNFVNFVNGNCDRSVILNNFINICDLKQCNTIKNFMSRFLDLVLSNLNNVEISRCEQPLIKEDMYHPALDLCVQLNFRYKDNNIHSSYTYDYAKGNYDMLYNLISSIDWSVLTETQDANQALDIFYQEMYSCIEKSIPKKKVKNSHYKPKYPKYFSVDLIRKIKRKNQLHTKVKRGIASTDNVTEYKILRREIKADTEREYSLYVANVEGNINEDPSSFWLFVETRKDTRGIPSEMHIGDNIFNNSIDISNAFADYYHSVFEQSCDGNLNSQGTVNFSTITEAQLRTAVNKLKPKKSTGSDNIPPYIYKGCVDFLVKPLLCIFNMAIQTNCFPDRLKQSIVTPVFKSGNRDCIENYRPVSVLNCVAKIFESILYDDLYNNCEKLFASQQHGFLSGRSTTSNLTELTSSAWDAVLNKNQLDVIMTDCSKAFDKVDHGILLEKLGAFSLSSNVLQFFKSYLSDRFQQVKIGHSLSKKISVTSGVPQGSNLGPLLFNIFINDLPNCISYSSSLLFADDFKIYKAVSTLEDSIQLQLDLISVENWFERNKMFLNAGKCLIITYTRKMNFLNYDYCLNNTQLNRVDKCKDLGVHLQSNLKFNDHFEYIVNRAYKILGFIIRNSKFLTNIHVIVRLYNALVRPILEYASIVWSPKAITNIDLIEKVQKRFLRYLYLRTHNVYPCMVSYRAMLTSFKFITLEIRRSMQSVLFIYFIVNNVKYNDIFLMNRISLNVPKINLRINNYSTFYVNQMGCSPIELMLEQCNVYMKKYNFDIFRTSVKEIGTLLLGN